MERPSAVRDALRNVMQRGADAPLSDDEFNSLALQVFAHQYQHNMALRRYCERRNVSPENVEHWTQVPAVPTAAFKEIALVAGSPADAQLVFRTSGTTRGNEQRGTHYVLDGTLYQDSLLATFRAFVLADRECMRIFSLVPPATEAPDSSLSYMVSTVLHQLGSEGSAVFASVNSGLAVAALDRALAQASEPVCIIGTSLALLHWLEASELKLVLPAGSRIMDTGGFKGEQREISPRELRELYDKRLGIPARYSVNEYGMTELCSQYYDAALRDTDVDPPHVKQGPPWLRARVVDADTLSPVRAGEHGILHHYDLANLNSVSAVLTEDLAYEVAEGFVLLGRAPGAMPRGCSIAMDLLLQNARSR